MKYMAQQGVEIKHLARKGWKWITVCEFEAYRICNTYRHEANKHFFKTISGRVVRVEVEHIVVFGSSWNIIYI